MNARHLRTRQRGAVLVVALVMLVLLTLFVLSILNMSNVNLRVAGNNQARNQALAAAQQAIEYVSSFNFTTAPAASTVNVDINGDGTNDFAVAVDKPVCMNSVPIKTTELDIGIPADVACFASSASTTSGILPAATGGNSLCSNTQWDLRATVQDSGSSGSQTNATVHQGVGVRVPIGTTC